MKLRALPAAAAALALAAAAPAHAAFFPAEAVDGPSADINPGASGAIEVDVAPDGTGALAYLKNDGGVAHVFVSTLSGGVWSAPERVDDGLPEASASPVVAVGNGGRVAVAFLNDANSDVVGVVKPGAGAPFGAPDDIQSNGAGDAAAELQLDMGPTGVAYAVWRLQSVGTDVYVGRLEGESWSLIPTQMNTDPDNQVSNQGNGPETAIGVDGAGNGVVLWNEVIGTDRKGYVRRLNGTTPGPPIQASVDEFEGLTSAGDINAIMVDLDVGADGSAIVVMRQDFDNKARAIGRRLGGDQFGAPFAFDNQAFPDFQDNAEMPEVDLAPDGLSGLVASQRNLGKEVFAGPLTTSGLGALTNLNPADAEEYVQPAVAASASGKGLVAVNRQTSNDVVARYYDGSAFGGEVPVSSEAFGNAVWFPGNVDHVSADDQGNVAIALYQGAAADSRVVVSVFDAPPTPPTTAGSTRFRRDRTPALSWNPATDLWGGVQSYSVTIDGKPAGTTTGTSLTAPKLGNGRHTWTVTALDRRGQATTGPEGRLNIDAKKPKARLKIRGKRRVGKKVRFVVTAKDGRNAAGIARVRIAFGDRKRASKRRLRKGKASFGHRYKKAKRFKVKITVIDRAGNRRVVRKRLRINP